MACDSVRPVGHAFGTPLSDSLRAPALSLTCLEGMETEAAFLKALGLVGGWKIVGRHLELLVSAGAVLAQFEAVYL